MTRFSKTAVLIGIAALAGTAGAARISGSTGREGPDRGVPNIQDVNWTITHDASSTSYIKALTISLTVPDTGEILPFAFFLVVPAPSATESGSPRAVESIDFFNVGPNGESVVKFTFADASLWSPGETITFGLKADFQGGGHYLIGEDYEFTDVPTPGAAALGGLGFIALARRRR